jgi:hypothetical protein
MKVLTSNRRQFLVGAGGALLALPFLESLAPKKARAAGTVVSPRFVGMSSGHGAVSEANMYPSDSTLTAKQSLYSDHEVRRGALSPAIANGTASLSPVLSAPSTLLTTVLAAKLNVIRGLDVSFNLGHASGGYFGNYARNDGGLLANDWRPTIDQVMAWSSSFYPDLGSIKARSMQIGLDGRLASSWGWSNPQTKSGSIDALPTSFSSKDLFDSIFVQSMMPVSTRKPVVDHVIDAFRSLKSGAFGDATRLSVADKQRLQDHMDRLSELQQRVNAVASCGTVMPPSHVATKNDAGFDTTSNLAGHKELFQTFNDVIVAAFICGTCRIATISPPGEFAAYPTDWHHEVAHTAQNDPSTQTILAGANRNFFEDLFLDLAAKLDVEEGGGKTYLDNTLIMWTQESGPSTHDPFNIPVVTAGSAAGFLATGNYVDYRRIGTDKWNSLYPGILYNQWLGTVLQAMRLPPSEYERAGEHGYGSLYYDNVYGTGNKLWPDRLRSDAGQIVPFLKA